MTAPLVAARDPLAARRTDLAALEGSGVDLLIVGGGITGAGAARDATLRGLRVAVVEQSDWASGTSSKSSKLVHGGLRYLESYEFGLVMESTRERFRQRKLNPHLVEPLPFFMPVYAGGPHRLFTINIGLWLYDLLALFRAPKRHRRLNAQKAAALVPPLRQDALQGGVAYSDCSTDDARLTLANVLDARRHGALAFSRMRYLGPVQDGDRVVGARLHDRLLDHTFTAPCRHIIQATGPWTDQTGALTATPPRLRPTKGVHIVVDRARVPIDVALALSAVDDQRVVFAIPWHNTTYIGTTDTDFSGDPAHIHADAADVAYLLRTANHFFPEADLTAADVRSVWSGLRPLIHSAAATAYQTSREHHIYDDGPGMTTIAGGKLTTYRAMAAEVVDHAIRALQAAPAPLPKLARCRTHKLPVDPTAGPAPTGDPLALCLWHTHGSLAAEVTTQLTQRPAEAARITPELPFILAQVSIAARHEDAWDLQDVLVRRLQVFYRAADAGLAAARPVATVLARELGRDSAWIDAEVAAYEAFVAAELACARTTP